MSQKLHVCQICGKKFATPKGVCGHQRMHSGLQRIWGFKDSRVCSVSMETETLDLLRIGSSFMTENEQHEVIEAAMNLVMMSQQVYDFAAIRNLPPGDDSMDLDQLEPMQEKKNLHCVESKLDDLSELLTHSGFKKSSTCSDVVAQALPSPLRSKLQNSSYKCRICGKVFGCSKALGGHHRLHRSIKGQLVRKKEYIVDDNSLSDSSEAKKIVSQPSVFEVSQDEKILHRVESKVNSSEVLAYSGFGKPSSCGKTRFSALHHPLRSKSNSSCRFKICGKSFGWSQALGGHQTLYRSIKGQSARTEDGNSLSGETDSEVSKFVSQPSSSLKSQGI